MVKMIPDCPLEILWGRVVIIPDLSRIIPESLKPSSSSSAHRQVYLSLVWIFVPERPYCKYLVMQGGKGMLYRAS